VEAICLKCLAKDPSQRYATAGELAAALRPFAGIRLSAGTLGLPLSFANTGSTAHIAGTPSATVSLDPSVLPGRKAPRRRLPSVLVAGALVLVGIGVGLTAYNLKYRGQAVDNPVNTDPNGSAVQEKKIDQDLPDMEPVFVPQVTFSDFKLDVEMFRHDSGSGKRFPMVPDQANGEYRMFTGETVGFEIQVEKDAYVGLWTVDTEGKVLQLFPNKEEQNHLVPAGKPRGIPSKTTYDVSAELSKGKEFAWVVASTRPWKAVKGEEVGPFIAFSTKAQREELQSALRGFLVKPREEGKDPAEVAEKVLTFRVLPVRKVAGR